MNEVHLDTLLRRFSVDGDPDAAGALFDATAPGLFRLALALTPDAATAEDVLQSTFLVVLESAPRYDPARPAWPWLVGILKVKAMEARRRSGRTPDPARVRSPGAPGNPLADAASAEETEEVRRALEELEEPYRSVALLRWRYGLEPAEIAHVRGQAPGTVSSLLSRALGKLRRRLTALPAVFLGTRIPRGLEDVRREVVRGAAAAAVATGGAGAHATTIAATGGALMANKMLAAAAIVAVAGLAWWARPISPPVPQPPHRFEVSDPSVDLLGRNPAAAPPASPDEPLPPVVDLAGCDRDLDLFGTVVDAAGKPVGGARLTAFVEPWKGLVLSSNPRFEESEPVAGTRSAADGTFAIRLDRGRSVSLRAGAAGFAETVLPSCVAGERVTVALHPGASLEVVLLEEDGKPCAGRPILLFRMEAPAFRRKGTSSADGRCQFPGLTPGPAWITTGRRTRGDDSHPVIPASGTLRLELVLIGGAAVTGRVTDAGTGAAIPGALVRPNDGVSLPVATDAEGRWSIHSIPEPSSVPVLVTARGYVSAVAGMGELREDSIDTPLRRVSAVRGRVVDAAGHPVAGARVGAMGTKDEEDAGSAFAGRIPRSDSSAAVTGTGGEFALEDLDPELPHTAIVAAVGFARTIRVLDAGSTDAGDIVLGTGGRIEGVLVDHEGNPVRHGKVVLAPLPDGNPWSRVWARTDDLGRFRWAGVPPGNYMVRSYEGTSPWVESPVTLNPGKDALDVVLRARAAAPAAAAPAARERPPTGVVSGVVLGPSSEPEPRMSVGAFDEAGTRWTGAFCDEEGRFAVDIPLGRTFALVVDGQRRWTLDEMKDLKRKYGQVPNAPPTNLRGRFEGVTAPSTGIAIRLHVAEKERSLPVRVLDAGGVPVTGLKVLCQGRTLATDAAGRVKFEGMEAVEVEVLVHADRADALAADTLVPEPVKLVPENREVVLRCRTGTSVEGVVLAPDGTPRPGARLFLATTTGQAGMPLGNPAVADDQGRFRLSGLAGVPQRVWASWFDPAGRAFGGEAAVTPPASGVEIRLAPNPR